jgi:hypothetical protein
MQGRRYRCRISLVRYFRASWIYFRDVRLCSLRRLRQRCLVRLNNIDDPRSISTVLKRASTSRTLNRTYNLMVLWPRMEWYTLLASNSVIHKHVRTIKSPFNKSALSEGCNFLLSEGTLRVIPWPFQRTSRKPVP